MVFLYLTVCLGSHDKQINKPTDSDGDAATAAADFPGPRQWSHLFNDAHWQ